MHTLMVCPHCEKLNRVALERTITKKSVCGSCGTELPHTDSVQEVSGATLSKLVRASDRPVVVDFWADWCAPCKSFSPTFKSAARELGDHMIFAKVNTETSPQTAQTYNIRGIPTLIVFKNGAEVERQTGALPLPSLMEHLERWRAL